MPHKDPEKRKTYQRERMARIKLEDPEYAEQLRVKNLEATKKCQAKDMAKTRANERAWRKRNYDVIREKRGYIPREQYLAELEEKRRKAREYMKKWNATEQGQRARCARTIYRNFRQFGFDIDQYDKMYEEQAGLCAVCSTPRPKYGQLRFHIDHDHATGKIRGLLCPACNAGLGSFRESKATMDKALDYLGKAS